MNLRTLVYAASLGAITYLQPYRPYVVDGSSMNPTLSPGQWVVGRTRPHHISRGDIVVFRRDGDTMIKRVAYLPGDRIERYRLADEWVIPTNDFTWAAMVRRKLPRHDLVVPEGHVFVVGDNYFESVDSRTYGPVPSEDVLAVLDESAPLVDGWYAPSHLTSALTASL